MKLIHRTLAAAVLATASLSAHAVPVLDQSYEAGTGSAGLGLVTTTNAQVFEVGLAGLLDSVEVQIVRNFTAGDDLTVDIFTVAGGVPTSTSLATVVVPFADVPMTETWFNVDVSAASIIVSPGDVLAIGLSTQIGSHYSWRAGFDSIPDPLYPQGDSCSRNAPGAFSCTGARDYKFRTYVDPDGARTDVPAPAPVALLALGLVGMLVRRSTRRG